MSVDELIDEGYSFLQAHPSASAERVRTHLEGGYGNQSAAVREELGWRYSYHLEFWLLGLLTRQRDRRRVDEAMRVLFPKGRRA